MTVRVYRSSDTSAPSAGRSTGSLITLLDAVLVNGYGSKSPLGWTKEFSATNKAMYKQGSGSSARYLYVDDSAAADYATALGLVAPTSITTLTADPFPSSGTRYISKPDSGWVVVGNEKAFYLFTYRGAWGSVCASFYFGDIVSLLGSTDTGRAVLLGSGTTTTTTLMPQQDALSSMTTSLHMSGNFTASAVAMGNLLTYAAPNVLTGGYLYAPVCVYLAASVVSPNPDMRGYMPGMAWFLHPSSAVTLPAGTTIAGSGLYAGKTYEVFRLWASGTSSEVPILIETSDTWSN